MKKVANEVAQKCLLKVGPVGWPFLKINLTDLIISASNSLDNFTTEMQECIFAIAIYSQGANDIKSQITNSKHGYSQKFLKLPKD